MISAPASNCVGVGGGTLPLQPGHRRLSGQACPPLPLQGLPPAQDTRGAPEDDGHHQLLLHPLGGHDANDGPLIAGRRNNHHNCGGGGNSRHGSTPVVVLVVVFFGSGGIAAFINFDVVILHTGTELRDDE